MANTKSAIKRIRRISKQTAVNKARRSRYKNALKKMNLLIESKKKTAVSTVGKIMSFRPKPILFFQKIEFSIKSRCFYIISLFSNF